MGLLRLALAMSVVSAHTTLVPRMLSGVGGIVAVEAFFAISGFYMAMVLSSTYKNKNKGFYLNRVLRIYPEYWLVALLTLITQIAFTGQKYFEQFSSIPLAGVSLVTFANTFIFGSDLVLFTQISEGSLLFGPFQESVPLLHPLLLIPQAWTLSLELCFYLVAPLLVKLRTLSLLFILFCGWIIKYLIIGYVLRLPDPWVYRFSPFELTFFIAGILLFRLHRTGILEKHKSSAFVPVAALLGAIFLCAPALFEILANKSVFLSQYLLPLVLVVAIISTIPLLFALTSSSKFDRELGNYSYPVYLSHVLVIGIMSFGLRALDLNDSLESPVVGFAILLLALGVTNWPLVQFGKVMDRYRNNVKSKLVD